MTEKQYYNMDATNGSLGLHMLAELYQCNPEAINDISYIEKHMKESAHIAGATIVSTSFHPFSPYGISGVIVVKESHFTIHTWPEYNYAAIDFFTCNNRLRLLKAYEYLTNMLQSKEHTYKMFNRGKRQIIDSLTDINIK